MISLKDGSRPRGSPGRRADKLERNIGRVLCLTRIS